MSRTVVLLAFCALTGASSAQRAWIVDAANGPGAHFTDLPQALVAASDGDTIRMRSGNYAAATTSKGVTIVGETSSVALTTAPTTAGLVVTGLPAGVRFVLKRVVLAGPIITLSNNAGLVLLDSVDHTIQGFYQAMVSASNCAALQMANCRISGWPALDVVNSTVVVNNCQLIGVPTGNGLKQNGGDVTILGGPTLGGAGNSQKYGFAPPGAGIVAYAGTLRIAGAGANVTAGSYLTFQTPAIQALAAMQIVLDPVVQLVPAGGAPPIAGGGSATTRALASLTAAGAGPGGTLATRLTWRASEAAVLVAGRPIPPVAIPDGRWWINPSLILVLDTGAIGGSGVYAANIPLPNDPTLAGLVLALHSIVTNAGGLALSNGDVVVLY